MNLLHVHFALRNQQAFRRALSTQSGPAGTPTPSTSAGKGSYGRPGTLSTLIAADVNARDWLGRTVLHLACASVEPSAIEYVRLLLAHPAININLQDTESHWTALHRALYHGNIAAAILLVQRNEIDLSLKDLEGYTAFDLYNSTVEHTKPSPLGKDGADLFTWGANRNATLGVGNADDRAYPEQVILRHAEDAPLCDASLDARFASIRFRQVGMSKLHTGVVTTERSVNVRLCGFGSGGRLGPGQHTQYELSPLAQLHQQVVALALGQDHTLALTRAGEVYSWGLNRFAQLGYTLDAPIVTSVSGGTGVAKSEEPIQAVPKRIIGPLRKEVVLGVAACKTASACWTDRELFTWGTNAGQLGYDRTAQPVQGLPRIVTKITQPVVGVALSDTALACLLSTREVVCLWNDRHIRINFPTQTWPSEITPYRPPQATEITKVTSCDSAFAALSSQGEVFTFTPPTTSADGTTGPKGPLIKPQRVWALRKKFSAVRDVALGADGALVVCTESGHVYVRSRTPKSGVGVGSGQKAFKFQRIPFLQRVAAVCANSTGAFGALRTEHKPPTIEVVGRTIAEDIAELQPYMLLLPEDGQEILSAFRRRPTETPPVVAVLTSGEPDVDADEEGEDTPVAKDISAVRQLLHLLRRDRETGSRANCQGIFDVVKLAYGADLIVNVGSFKFPAHRVLTAARCRALEDILDQRKSIKDAKMAIQAKRFSTGPACVLFAGFQPLTVLLLFVYLYSDDLPTLWDRRVMLAIEPQLAVARVHPMQVKSELATLARMLELPLLGAAVEPHVKRAPASSMIRDMRRLYERTHEGAANATHHAVAPDVVLQLADREVPCHSLALRARSPFFAAFFDDEDWTSARWTEQRTMVVDMKHLRWRSMEYVLRFLCYGEDREMFEMLEFLNSVDEVLDFMFEVKAAANELHVERLILLCSEVILRHVNVHNVCSLLGDASYLHSFVLVSSLQSYMTVNMETLLESRLLEELAPDLVKQLSKFVRQKQAEKSSITRGGVLLEKAMARFGNWLALQDIPVPIVPTQRMGPVRESPKLSSPTPFKKGRRASGPTSPTVRPQITAQPVVATFSHDDIFIMDEVMPALSLESTPSSRQAEVPPKPIGTWKSVSAAPKSDMKSIMAEAESSKAAQLRPSVPSPSMPKTPQREWRKVSLASPEPARTSAAMQRTAPAAAIQRTPSGNTPWKVPGALPVMIATDPSSSPPEEVLSNSRGGISRTKSNSNIPAASSSTPPTPGRLPAPTPPRAGPQQPGLGPVISPLRQPSFAKAEASSSRRASSTSNKAWTLPPVHPVVQSSPAAATTLSFADIQAMQFEQSLPPTKDKRSLREIQQEEQARQVEADFLKWWEEAEARVRLEAEGPIQDVTPASGQRKAKTTKASKGNAVAAAQDHGSGLGTAEVRQHGHPPSVGNPKDDQGSRGGMHQKARGSAQPGFEPPQPGDIFMTHERQGEARRGGRGGRGAHRGGRGGHGAHGQLSTTRPLTQIT